MRQRTFYDQWHRIAGLRVGLRPGVAVRLHDHGGEPWYVLHDPAHGGFFRVRPPFRDLVLGLTPAQPLEALWRRHVAEHPDTAPGQEEFYALVTALYDANLIYVEGGVDEAKLLARPGRKKRKNAAQKISELLFFRVPLWDPEPWLRRHAGAFAVIYSPPAVLAVLGLALWAAHEVFVNRQAVLDKAGDILQLTNLVPLYLAIFGAHILHELSHAAATKHCGGHVRTMGVMLLMFTPLPYADLTAAWAFRNRWKRAWVGAAGIYADIASCAVAALVWTHSPPGAVNEMAYNVMVVTAAYTALFNINPLMRFDGYYILSDVVGEPNLHASAKQQWEAAWRRLFLGESDPADDAVAPRRRAALVGFFVVSNIYRLVVMVGIMLFVADRYFGFGLLVAAAIGWTTLVQPAHTLLTRLRNPLFMMKHRTRIRWTGAAVAALALAVLALPLPHGQRLDGVLEAAVDTPLFAETGGRVAEVRARPGAAVAAGDVLIVLDNPELALDLTEAEARIRSAEVSAQLALAQGAVELSAVEERLAMLRSVAETLRDESAGLVIRAPHDGIWTGEDPRRRLGGWVGRGHDFGRVIDDRSHVFLGVIRQELARELGDWRAERVSVRVEGARHVAHGVSALSLVPFSRRDLPSAALGPLARGAMAVSARDQTGREAVEQFFLVRATMDAAGLPPGQSVQAGRSGWARVALAPRPLGTQVALALRQFFQRRYQL